MGTIQEVIEKVQKLRRLATSSNVHEAAAAAAAADKLIQEHGLAEAQLEVDGQTAAERPEQETLTSWTRIVTWERVLAKGLANHYDCTTLVQPDYVNARSETKYQVIGRPSDLASVRYMFAWLVVEIERLAQQNRGQGRVWLRSFRHGAVEGVLSAMRESKQAARETATSTALVLVDQRLALAEAERERLHPDMTKTRGVRFSHDPYAFRQGQSAGRSLHQTDARLAASGTRALPKGGDS